MDLDTGRLLARYLEELRPTVPLVALWAHGSLGSGDYQPGRSDLDLIAVVESPVTPTERLVEIHRGYPELLHCSFIVRDELPDLAAEHLTWAYGEFFHRPVTPVTRRELHSFPVELYGEAPGALLPPVSDTELNSFILADLENYWLVKTDGFQRWLMDVWVDLGLITVARARVTLQEGRLITKAEALDLLAELDAPARVVADIRARRYGMQGPTLGRARRAMLARRFVRAAIRRTLTECA
ncbi:nucleotidyltransferase domain-containing protein [Nonomuraea sp. NBC_01738]|uniref:nucleotidyltransferase domain-containing protein n=1 Tax=Nonomuraea sp. NBC_01738 TaxID=2976003 RepID=UPI002E12976A|nr:nucleotidyltransferase domain-containing protein [Nonomuraea sp. NBC_01738]